MSNIPIFLASDNNYAPFVAIVIASICHNTQSYIQFYVLDSGISNFNKNQINTLKEKYSNFEITYIEVQPERFFSGFEEKTHITLAMYNRFLIPLLKPDIDKALYLDVDIIVLGDISELYHENLADHVVGAIFDTGIMTQTQLNSFRQVTNLSKYHKYFNSGVLLIDCEQWRKNDITEKLFTIEKNYRSKWLAPDQDILNKCFENNYQQLNLKYNCFGYYEEIDDYIVDEYFQISKDTINKAMQECIVRHYATYKPWQRYVNSYGKPIKNFNEFWFFASLTPFFAGLQQQFIYHMHCRQISRANSQVMNNIKLPSKELLAKLRNSITDKR